LSANKSFGPDISFIAIAQRVNFGAGSVFGNATDIPTLKQIQVQLNMSRATNLMATLEIWDNRLDSVNNSVPDSTLKPLCKPIPFKGTSDGWCCYYTHMSPPQAKYPRRTFRGGDMRCSICYIPNYMPNLKI
jgi:hypothetical protein